jgi:hypothetical protein
MIPHMGGQRVNRSCSTLPAPDANAQPVGRLASRAVADAHGGAIEEVV